MQDTPAEKLASVTGDSLLLTRLLGDALTLLERDQTSARRRIEQACTLVRSEGSTTVIRGGLAPWQVRRVETYIHDNLGHSLLIEDVAALANLSASYFSRAFKVTFGIAFSPYVMQQRIERAKHLLLTTQEPICEIALACGLADQSHLTRLFSRAVGLPPRAWRRYMQVGPLQMTG